MTVNPSRRSSCESERKPLSIDNAPEKASSVASYAARGFSHLIPGSTHRAAISRPQAALRALAWRRGVLALSVVTMLFVGPRDASSRTTPSTPEARLVNALSLLDSRRGAEALKELRGIVSESPTWETARSALGSTLLRRGLFVEARSEFAQIVGRDAVTAIENGDGAEVELTPTQMDALFGLAICRDEEGEVRRADRLYRAYADRMGLASPKAARAFHRLAVMFERVDVPWGDAAAERSRALALDPTVGDTDVLPPLPDPGADPRTEPYTRVIQLVDTAPPPAETDLSLGDVETADDDTTVVARGDSTVVTLVPPVLASYIEPWPETVDVDSPPGGGDTLNVELLVNADGIVEDVRVDGCDTIDCSALVDLTFAAARWLFTPATVDGEPVAARIAFPVPLHEAPVATSTEEPESAHRTESTEGAENTEGTESAEGEGP